MEHMKINFSFILVQIHSSEGILKSIYSFCAISFGTDISNISTKGQPTYFPKYKAPNIPFPQIIVGVKKNIYIFHFLFKTIACHFE